MTATYSEYMRDFSKFSRKHSQNGDFRIYTSPMENNRYHKEYCWEDGAQWCEVSELITEEVEIEVHGLIFKTSVEMWRTEYWSTEAPSKYYYCK